MSDGAKNKVLSSRLRAVWRRTQRKHLSAGVLAMCRWCIPLFLVGMAIDWFIDVPAEARFAVLGLLVVVCLYKAWKNGWRHLRFFDATRTALEVERKQGGLESLLVSAVQFAKSKPAPGTSEALWEVTRSKAEAAARGVQPCQSCRFERCGDLFGWPWFSPE